MATYEKRRNSLGEITAIRVKIRRVGMPHLSQTFPVANGTQTALKQAEKAAKAWADEVTKGIGIKHGNSQSFRAQFNQLGMNQNLQTNQEPHPKIMFHFDRLLSKNQGDDLILHTQNPEARILTALVLDCGLSLNEITRLRWQNILLNQKLVEVTGLSGMVNRLVALTPMAIEALLAYNQRKYGLMFNMPLSELYHQLPITLIQTLKKNSHFPIETMLRIESAHRMADSGKNEQDICAFLGIKTLQGLLVNLNPISPDSRQIYI